MATASKRYCIFCDNEVKPATQAIKEITRPSIDAGGGDLYVHVKGTGGCGRNTLTETNTYTEGYSDSE